MIDIDQLFKYLPQESKTANQRAYLGIVSLAKEKDFLGSNLYSEDELLKKVKDIGTEGLIARGEQEIVKQAEEYYGQPLPERGVLGELGHALYTATTQDFPMQAAQTIQELIREPITEDSVLNSIIENRMEAKKNTPMSVDLLLRKGSAPDIKAGVSTLPFSMATQVLPALAGSLAGVEGGPPLMALTGATASSVASGTAMFLLAKNSFKRQVVDELKKQGKTPEEINAVMAGIEPDAIEAGIGEGGPQMITAAIESLAFQSPILKSLMPASKIKRIIGKSLAIVGSELAEETLSKNIEASLLAKHGIGQEESLKESFKQVAAPTLWGSGVAAGALNLGSSITETMEQKFTSALRQGAKNEYRKQFDEGAAKNYKEADKEEKNEESLQKQYEKEIQASIKKETERAEIIQQPYEKAEKIPEAQQELKPEDLIPLETQPARPAFEEQAKKGFADDFLAAIPEQVPIEKIVGDAQVTETDKPEEAKEIEKSLYSIEEKPEEKIAEISKKVEARKKEAGELFERDQTYRQLAMEEGKAYESMVSDKLNEISKAKAPDFGMTKLGKLGTETKNPTGFGHAIGVGIQNNPKLIQATQKAISEIDSDIKLTHDLDQKMRLATSRQILNEALQFGEKLGVDTSRAAGTFTHEGVAERYKRGEYQPETKLAYETIQKLETKGELFDIAGPTKQKAFTPLKTADVRELFNNPNVTLTRGARGYEVGLGKDKTLKITFSGGIKGNPKVLGRYKRGANEIDIFNVPTKKPQKITLTHEAIHFFEDSGIINPRQAKAIKKYAEDLIKSGEFKSAGEVKAYAEKGAETVGRENLANILADMINNTDYYIKPRPDKSLISKAIIKIRDFIKKISGIKTGKEIAEKVVREIKTGKIYDQLFFEESNLKGYENADAYLYDMLPDEHNFKIESSYIKKLKDRFSTGVSSVKKDISLIEDIFGVPYILGKKYDKIKKAVNYERKAHENRSRALHKLYHGKDGLEAVQQKVLKDKKVLMEFENLVHKWDGKAFPEAEVRKWFNYDPQTDEITIQKKYYTDVDKFLKSEGVTDLAREAFIKTRKAMDWVFYDTIKTMKTTAPKGTIKAFMANIGEINNYFPHRREGDSYIQIVTKNDDLVYREHFFKLRERLTTKKAKNRAKEWLNKEIDAGRLKGNIDDYIIQDPKEIKEIPDELFFDVGATDIQKVIDLAIDQTGASDDFRSAINESVANIFKKRGWAGHMIKRKNIGGYKKDETFATMFDYFSGYLGFKTKIQRSMQHAENFKGVDPRKNPELYRYLKKYIRDVLSNQSKLDRAVSAFKAFAFVRYLGWVVKTAFINLTQNIVMAAPVLSLHTDTFLEAEKTLAKAMYDVKSSLTSKAAWTSKEVTYSKLSNEESKAIHEFFEAGTNIDKYLKDIKGNLKNSSIGKTVNKIIDTSGIFMSIAERFNRTSTGLAAFRIAKGKGLDYKTSVQFAKDIVSDSHFEFGKSNYPSAIRGSDKTSTMLRASMTFKSFLNNYMHTIAHLFLNEGSKGKIAVAKSIFNTFALSGLTAVPCFEFIANSILKAFGDDEDIFTKIRELIPSELMRDFMVYGGVGLTGADVSGSLAIGVPTTLDDFIGIPSAVLSDTVNTYKSLQSGNKFRALQETPFTPMVLKNALRGLELYKTGQRTRGGKDINYPGEIGPRKLTSVEALTKSVLGFQPKSLSKAYKAYSATKREQALHSERRQRWADQYVNAARANDQDTMRDIMRTVRDYNKKARKAGQPHKIVNLAKIIKNRLKTDSLKSIPRQTRRRALEIAGVWK